MCQSQKINTGIKEHFKIYMVYKKKVNIQQKEWSLQANEMGHLMYKDTDNIAATQSVSPQKRHAVKVRSCSV